MLEGKRVITEENKNAIYWTLFKLKTDVQPLKIVSYSDIWPIEGQYLFSSQDAGRRSFNGQVRRVSAVLLVSTRRKLPKLGLYHNFCH